MLSGRICLGYWEGIIRILYCQPWTWGSKMYVQTFDHGPGGDYFIELDTLCLLAVYYVRKEQWHRQGTYHHIYTGKKFTDWAHLSHVHKNKIHVHIYRHIRILWDDRKLEGSQIMHIHTPHHPHTNDNLLDSYFPLIILAQCTEYYMHMWER